MMDMKRITLLKSHGFSSRMMFGEGNHFDGMYVCLTEHQNRSAFGPYFEEDSIGVN